MKTYNAVIFAALAFFSLFTFLAFPLSDELYGIHVLRRNSPISIADYISVAASHAALYWGANNGTYTHIFIRVLLNPAYISVEVFRITLFGLYWFFVFSICYFFRALARYVLNFEPNLALAVSFSIAFIAVNGVTSPTQTFFWYSSAVNYMVVFSAILLFFAILIKMYYRHLESIKVSVLITRHFAALLLLVLINGSQQGGVLFLNAALLFCVLFITVRKVKAKSLKDIKFLYFYFAVSMVLGLINVVGTAGRAGGMSVLFLFRTAAYSVYTSIINFHGWNYGLTLILCLALLPSMVASIKKSELDFKHPIIASLVVLILHTTAIAAGLLEGWVPARLMDFAYFISLILFFLWFYYMVGYFVKAGIELPVVGNQKRLYAVAFCILLMMINTPARVISGNVAEAFRNIVYGGVTNHMHFMNSRIEILENATAKNIELAPNPFNTVLGDRSVIDSSYNLWTLRLVYDKNSLVISDDLGDRVFRVIAHPLYYAYAPVYEYDTYIFVDSVVSPRDYLIDITGRLPLDELGEVILHENVKLLLHGNDFAATYHVYPFVLNLRNADSMQAALQNFTTCIDISTLEDGLYRLFLLADGKYFFQGDIYVHRGFAYWMLVPLASNSFFR